MKDIFTPLDCRRAVIPNPIYMSREQFEDFVFIPEEEDIRSRIVVVDFVEEE